MNFFKTKNKKNKEGAKINKTKHHKHHYNKVKKSNSYDTINGGLMHKDRRIVMIGPTGSGKTSLIRLLMNLDRIYLNQIYGEDAIKIVSTIVKSNERGGRESESQTLRCMSYNTTINGNKLTLIDCPGIGDTRGLEYDQSAMIGIANYLNSLDYINGLILVINGTNRRWTTQVRYNMSSLMMMLPRSVFKNMFIVYTNSTSMLNKNFDHSELELLFNTKLSYITVNNPVSLISSALEHQLSKEDVEPEFLKALNAADHAIITMFEYMNKMSRTSAREFVILANLKLNIDFNLKHLILLVRDRALAFSLKILDRPRTVCIVCRQNCHDPCYLADHDLNEYLFECASIQSKTDANGITTGCCRKCKHGVEYHMHTHHPFTVSEHKKADDEEIIKACQLIKDNIKSLTALLRGNSLGNLKAFLQTKARMLQMEIERTGEKRYQDILGETKIAISELEKLL